MILTFDHHTLRVSTQFLPSPGLVQVKRFGTVRRHLQGYCGLRRALTHLTARRIFGSVVFNGTHIESKPSRAFAKVIAFSHKVPELPMNGDKAMSDCQITPVFSLGLLQSLIEERTRRDSGFLTLIARDSARAFYELMGLQLPPEFSLVEAGGRITMCIPATALSASSGAVSVVTTDKWRMIVESNPDGVT